MLETSPLISALSALADHAPNNPTGPAASVWDDLLALIQGVVQNIVNGANTTLSNLINGISGTIKDKIQGVKDFISGLSSNIYSWLFDSTTGLVKTLSDKIGGIAQKVIDGITDTFNGIQEAISGAIGKVVDAINSVIGAISNIGQTIADALKNALGEVASWIRTAVDSVINSAASFIGGIVDQVSDWLTTAYTNVKNWLTQQINAVSEWIGNTYQAIVDTINSVGTWISNTYQSITQTLQGTWNSVLDWLKGAVKTLTNFKDTVFKSVSDWWSTSAYPSIGNFVHKADELSKALSPILDAVISGDPNKAFGLIDQWFKGIGLPAPVGIIQNLLYVIGDFLESIKLRYIPAQVAASKWAEINLALTPLDLSLSAEAVHRGVIDQKEYIENAKLSGITPDRALKALETSKPLTPPQVVKDVFMRGFITETQHDSILEDYGFTGDVIQQIKKTYPEIPPITDLVHFADRFAWDDDIAKRFQYDTEFPDVVNEWASKIGLSPEWFKRYWRSHWQLPSLQDIFEMYHRLRPNEVDKPFSESDLNDYLKTTPLPPYFHELLKEITYVPLTRVDIRRMYQAKVLTEDQVYKAYLDIGYDKVKAGWLKDFTIKYYTPEDQTQRDEFFSQARTAYSTAYKHSLLSVDEYKSFLLGLGVSDDDATLLISLDDFAIADQGRLFDINSQRSTMRKLSLSAYDNGLIDPSEAVSLLESLGEDENEANLELSVMDYNHQMQDRQAIVDSMHDQFVGYMIDETELHTTLGMFNFSGLEIDKLVASWNMEKGYRTKRPALADLRKFLTQGLITIDDFLNELRGLGYNEKYISLYNQSLKMAKAG